MQGKDRDNYLEKKFMGSSAEERAVRKLEQQAAMREFQVSQQPPATAKYCSLGIVAQSSLPPMWSCL